MKRKRIVLLILLVILLSLAIAIVIKAILPKDNITEPAKPVIYLYPKEVIQIEVELEYDGELTCTYPKYEKRWSVLAKPNGTIINIKDGREYSYLFWEGKCDFTWNIEEGFVIEGENTLDFLQEKLEFMGLTPKEYNEFIVYWLPMMQENKYNLIYFSKEEYEEIAKLNIEPQPDSILRVFMVYKALDSPIDIPEQELESFIRKGFCVIEWGGTEIK